MAKIKIIFLIVCVLTGFGGLNNSSGNLNGQSQNTQPVARNTIGTQTYNPQHANLNTIIAIAQSQIGVKERTGNNDGKAVETYLRYTNLPKGNPWCASFVSWVFGKAGFEQPRTPWSPALFPKQRLSSSIKSGLVYGLYDIRKKRIVHCGIATRKTSNWVLGVEGNTNVNGSVDGDGVYVKRRHIRTIHSIADWVK